jgi:hypothetical protein
MRKAICLMVMGIATDMLWVRTSSGDIIFRRKRSCPCPCPSPAGPVPVAETVPPPAAMVDDSEPFTSPKGKVY